MLTKVIICHGFFFIYEIKNDYELSYAFAKVRFVVVQQSKNLF